MGREKFFKSLIGSRVKISVLDYDGDYIVSKPLSFFTYEDYEYYKTDDFIMVDYEMVSDVHDLYMQLVE